MTTESCSGAASSRMTRSWTMVAIPKRVSRWPMMQHPVIKLMQKQNVSHLGSHLVIATFKSSTCRVLTFTTLTKLLTQEQMFTNSRNNYLPQKNNGSQWVDNPCIQGPYTFIDTTIGTVHRLIQSHCYIKNVLLLTMIINLRTSMKNSEYIWWETIRKFKTAPQFSTKLPYILYLLHIYVPFLYPKVIISS